MGEGRRCGRGGSAEGEEVQEGRCGRGGVGGEEVREGTSCRRGGGKGGEEVWEGRRCRRRGGVGGEEVQEGKRCGDEEEMALNSLSRNTESEIGHQHSKVN